MSVVEIAPLGGCGEIGKNMTVVRQGGDMLVVDAGLSFPSAEMHGVELVIPDISYLRENAQMLRGIVLTHAHEDHIGALAYCLQHLNVPVYGSELTLAIAKRKITEDSRFDELDLRPFKSGDRIEIGSFEIEPVFVTHSIPDAHAIAIRTGVGIILFTGDFKFDFSPIDGRLSDLARLGELGNEGVTVLLCDSTNIEDPGWCPSERSVQTGFEKIFREAEGRILITCFGSNIHRVQQAFDCAHKFGRKVAIAGRSMDRNTSTAVSVGKLRIPGQTLIRLEDAKSWRNDEVVILTTGTQGEPLSALSLMSRSEYPRLQIEEGDTVVYSAKPIPGNEAAIWQTVNRLVRQGANVIYGSAHSIHVSGHGYQEEIKMMVSLTKPQYIAPVHGEPRHQFRFKKIAEQMGYQEDNLIIMENGDHLIVTQDEAYFSEPVPCGRVLVDTSGTPGVSDDLLRDRGNLASSGIVFINVAIDSDAGKLIGKPEVLSRGLHVLDGELSALTEHLQTELAKLDHADLRDTSSLQQEIGELARAFLKQQSNRRPMVVATVTDV